MKKLLKINLSIVAMTPILIIPLISNNTIQNIDLDTSQQSFTINNDNIVYNNKTYSIKELNGNWNMQINKIDFLLLSDKKKWNNDLLFYTIDNVDYLFIISLSQFIKLIDGVIDANFKNPITIFKIEGKIYIQYIFQDNWILSTLDHSLWWDFKLGKDKNNKIVSLKKLENFIEAKTFSNDYYLLNSLITKETSMKLASPSNIENILDTQFLVQNDSYLPISNLQKIYKKTPIEGTVFFKYSINETSFNIHTQDFSTNFLNLQKSNIETFETNKVLIMTTNTNETIIADVINTNIFKIKQYHNIDYIEKNNQDGVKTLYKNKTISLADYTELKDVNLDIPLLMATVNGQVIFYDSDFKIKQEYKITPYHGINYIKKLVDNVATLWTNNGKNQIISYTGKIEETNVETNLWLKATVNKDINYYRTTDLLKIATQTTYHGTNYIEATNKDKIKTLYLLSDPTKKTENYTNLKDVFLDKQLLIITVNQEKVYYDINLNKQTEYKIKLYHGTNYIEATNKDKTKTLYLLSDPTKKIENYTGDIKEENIENNKLLKTTVDGKQIFYDTDLQIKLFFKVHQKKIIGVSVGSISIVALITSLILIIKKRKK